MVGLLYLSVYPYQFDFGRPVPRLVMDWPNTHGDWLDSFLNVAAYVPLGILARRVGGWGVAVVLGAGLSSGIEFLQCFLPGRHPSMRDFLLNVTGSAAGFGLPGLGSGWIPSFLRPYGPMFRWRIAATFWILWFVWELAPLYPILRRHHLSEIWNWLTHPAFSFETCADRAVAVSALIAMTSMERWRNCLVMVLTVLAAGAIYGARQTYSEAAGLALGILLVKLPARWWAGLAVAWILWKQFHAIPGRPLPAGFEWLPFLSVEYSPYQSLQILAGKAMVYGVTQWRLMRAGVAQGVAWMGLVILIACGELAQLYLPGRTPESTDVWIALVMGWWILRSWRREID
jgi:VanZ family protein